MDEYTFEEVKEQHLQFILEIYNYYIINTTVTFHVKPLTIDEIKEILYFPKDSIYRSYTIKYDNNICGYCILAQYKKREAYNTTAEITIYLKKECIGKGLGKIALEFIETKAKEKNIHALIAVISGDNEKSIKLFEKNDYQKCAHYKEIGKKFNKYIDVVAYQKILI